MAETMPNPFIASDQEIFDWVLAKLRAQGKPSMRTTDTCAYRGDEDRRCAIGWLIPDERYRSTMEGRSLTAALNEAYPSLAYELSEERTSFLDRLQWAHDVCLCESVASWEEAMHKLATKHGLTYRKPAA